MKKITTFLMVLIVALGTMAQTTETYDFYNFASADGYMKAMGDPIAIATDGAAVPQYFTEAYKVENLTIKSTTMDFNDRFAFNPVSTGYQMYWRFRNTGTGYQKGLVVQWNGGKTANTTANMSILGLYNGDKVTIKYSIRSGKDANLKFVKSGIATLDGVAVLSGNEMKSGSTYTIVSADENATVNLDLFITDNNIGIHTVTIVSDRVTETVKAPEMAVTGAYNGNRTITITSAEVGTAGTAVDATYYTTDGTDPSKAVGTLYTEPVVVSEMSTLKAITYLANGIASEVTSLEVEAGTTISLNSNIVDVTSLAGEGDVKNPVVSNVYTSAGLIGTPVATVTCTFNGAEVTLPYTATEDGTLVATASADGYAQSTETLELKAGYAVTRSIDFTAMTEEYFFEKYSDASWTEVGSIRLANWNKSYTYTGTTLNGGYIFDNLLSCSGNSTYPLNVKFGHGAGRGTGSTYELVGGNDGDIAVYEMNESLAPTENLVKYTVLYDEDAKMRHAAGGSHIVAKVSIYSPVQGELTATDGTDFAGTGAYSSATYTPAIEAGVFGTICLPFTPDAASLENYSFFAMSSEGEGVLNFTQVDAPVANTPYIYCLNDGKEVTAITGGATVVSSTINNVTVGVWSMAGSFTNQTIDASADEAAKYYGFVPAQNKIVKANKNLVVKPYRAYFTAPKSASAMMLRITRDGETTEIAPADLDVQPTNVIYDITGRRVEKMEKGIYIVNGKKVIR